ncbi:cardiolipin hydrolase [Anaeramoeba flamelloides]|uniref:Mitochondrial cardiolipin hydrolase n=1 Tax=Anaeramoeba flamelloides TaxID=1746091 RepID=A0AAV7Z895_9EUKA|nr:cardiolipin hydrolase [Anaeramoeba flamelloides]
MKLLPLSLIFFLILASCFCKSPFSYDHQTKTYVANHEPGVTGSGDCTITPFFSPDHSIDSLTKLIESATKTLDIGTPGWGSWSGCSYPHDGLIGCTVDYQRDHERFTVFPAVLNALHRGVKVRILTNDFGSKPNNTVGLIDPLTFLQLAGAEVRYFTTVTFLHTKYIQVDRKTAAVSSVNFSYTSFMLNREAGMILNGDGAQPLIDFLYGIFSFDFSQGLILPDLKYSASDMAIIKDTSIINYQMPTPVPFHNAYVSPSTPFKLSSCSAEMTASPDFAKQVVLKALGEAQDSVAIMIYQITDDVLCNTVHDIATDSDIKEFVLLVSNTIYSSYDWHEAQKCYAKLYKSGVKIQMTELDFYKYSHQKFWIIDDHIVSMSTGNWSPTDYPDAPAIFPAYDTDPKEWRKTNRDYTIQLDNQPIAAVFRKVLDEDYKRGEPWVPTMGVKLVELEE